MKMMADEDSHPQHDASTSEFIGQHVFTQNRTDMLITHSSGNALVSAFTCSAFLG